MEQNITTETTLGLSIVVHKLLYIFYHELMGINNCSKVLWTASGLTIQDLLYLQQQKASTASNEVSKCRIDVDVLIIMASSKKKTIVIVYSIPQHSSNLSPIPVDSLSPSFLTVTTNRTASATHGTAGAMQPLRKSTRLFADKTRLP